MKTIGFVDYYIDEWHSNNYIGWINDICKKRGLDIKIAYAWAEADNGEGKLSTAEWCEKNGIVQCRTVEEICEKSDYLLVLAPSNPEKHLPFAKMVLPYGKNTYIDKTFAPNLDEAKQIFAIAEQSGTKIFSTSALRYATELDRADTAVSGMLVTGGGRTLEEYIIHQIEMVVRKMGIGAAEVVAYKTGKQVMSVVKYQDGRKAFLFYEPSAPFTVNIETENGKDFQTPVNSPYFIALLDDIITFYTEDIVPVAKEQTLEVIAIRDAVIRAEATPETSIAVEAIV